MQNENTKAEPIINSTTQPTVMPTTKPPGGPQAAPIGLYSLQFRASEFVLTFESICAAIAVQDDK